MASYCSNGLENGLYMIVYEGKAAVKKSGKEIFLADLYSFSFHGMIADVGCDCRFGFTLLCAFHRIFVYINV